MGDEFRQKTNLAPVIVVDEPLWKWKRTAETDSWQSLSNYLGCCLNCF